MDVCLGYGAVWTREKGEVPICEKKAVEVVFFETRGWQHEKVETLAPRARLCLGEERLRKQIKESE